MLPHVEIIVHMAQDVLCSNSSSKRYARNPNAFRRSPLSVEEIAESRMVNDPLTQYMFCSPDEGAAAIVLCRADIAHRYTSAPIYLRSSEVRSPQARAYDAAMNHASRNRKGR